MKVFIVNWRTSIDGRQCVKSSVAVFTRKFSALRFIVDEAKLYNSHPNAVDAENYSVATYGGLDNEFVHVSFEIRAFSVDYFAKLNR